jgi:DNA polymerase-3 subunit beta
MKVICDRGALVEATNLAAGVVSTRTPRPQLTCLKLEARAEGGSGAGSLTLSATDGEVSLRLATRHVEVQADGQALAPADKLRQIVAAQEQDPTLSIEATDDKCEIKGAGARYNVFGYPASEFPPLPELPAPEQAADLFDIDADLLSALVQRTIFSTARENSRYAINGVLMKREGKKIAMVATDGRRLALARGACRPHEAAGDGGQCIVPTKALSLVNKLLATAGDTVRVAVTDNQIMFDFGAGSEEEGAMLASNLVEGTFPPYEDVLPTDQDKRATLDADVLGSAVRRAALLTNEDSRGVRMAFHGGEGPSLRLSSRAPQMGEAEIEVELKGYEGDDIEVGFNPAFIVDALKVAPTDEVIFELKAQNRPGLLKAGADFLYVVMPVSLQ